MATANPENTAGKQHAGLSKLAAIFAEKYDIDEESVVPLINEVAFATAPEGTVTAGDILVFMLAANKYGLDPFMREICAMLNDSGRFEPVVSAAGWSKIITRQPNFGSISFAYAPNSIIVDTSQKCPEWIECEIYTKDFDRPTVVREYLIGNFRDTSWWVANTMRQLRHKALIQCGRLAFGLTGIADADDLVGKHKPAAKVATQPASAAAPEKMASSEQVAPAAGKTQPQAGPLTGGLSRAKQEADAKRKAVQEVDAASASEVATPADSGNKEEKDKPRAKLPRAPRTAGKRRQKVEAASAAA